MSDALTIYISRTSFGWESDIWRGDESLGGGTAPTFAGIYDMAYEIIYDNDPEWMGFNGNSRS